MPMLPPILPGLLMLFKPLILFIPLILPKLPKLLMLFMMFMLFMLFIPFMPLMPAILLGLIPLPALIPPM
jgi:hypothetical protein